MVVLTRETQPGMRELALRSGAQAYRVKQFTSGDDLFSTIQRAIAHVGMLPKEDRYRPL